MVFEDIKKSSHDLWVSTWQCVLHIIDMLEALISTEIKNHKLKNEYLYEVITEAIFFNLNRMQILEEETDKAD